MMPTPRLNARLAVIFGALAAIAWLFAAGVIHAGAVVAYFSGHPGAQDFFGERDSTFAIVLTCCAAFFWVLAHFQRIGPSETRCRKCGFVLRGLSQPRCPECGEAI